MSEKLVTIIYRIEPGCLGPDGPIMADDFCGYANLQLADFATSTIQWQVEPRFDKQLVEMEYHYQGKKLNESQLTQLLAALGSDWQKTEASLHEKIAEYIENYFGRIA